MSTYGGRSREWDTRSAYSTRDRDDRSATTTVKRYRYGADQESNAGDDRVNVEVRTSKRRDPSPEYSRGPARSDVRRTETVVIERDREDVRDSDRSYYDRDRDREYWRREPAEDVREVRITRDISRDPPRREQDDFELEHYTREREYYAQPERRRSPQNIYIRTEAPQPIIIRESEPRRQETIIIRERDRSPSPKAASVHESVKEEVKEDKLELVETKSVAASERQVVRRDHSPEEDWYYQRTTREVARRNREEEYDDREYRRDPRPRDTVSDYARGRERDYDDEVYYRRTVEEEGVGLRDHSPHHKRHLAEGALVGLAGAALVNSRNKRDGRSRSRVGNAAKLVGGAAAGTIGAELITRARSRRRSRSDSRERDYRDRRRGSRSRSASREGGNGGNWAKLAGVAALGALAGYAATRNKGDRNGDDRRSRSRRRRSSVGRRYSGSRSRSDSRSARNPKHRNSVIAKAGLASAAVAGLVERARSKSRGGKARSKSRIRTGLPIAATGLAGAALAGLYENKKAKRERREDNREARSLSRGFSRSRSRSGSRRRSRSRSKSRSKSRSVAPSHADRGPNDEHLIEYGDNPIEPGDPYERPHSAYGSRARGGSESPRRQSRNYIPEAAAAVGIGGVAAHEASKRRERKQAERERMRLEEERNESPQWGPYAQQPVQSPMQGGYQDPYYAHNGNNNFAPPPQAFSPAPQAYNNQGGYAPQQGYGHGPYGAQQGAEEPYSYQPPHQQEPYQNDGRYDRPHVSATQQRYVPEKYRSGAELDQDHSHEPRANNGSVDVNGHASPRSETPEGLERRSSLDSLGRTGPKSVAFDPVPEVHSASALKKDIRRHDREEAEEQARSQRRGKSPGARFADDSREEQELEQYDGEREDALSPIEGREGEEDRRRKHYHPRRRRRRHSTAAEEERGGYERRHRRHQGEGEARRGPSPAGSDETIELPARFDEQGRRKAERGDNPIADRLEDILSGKGTLGKMLYNLGGGSGSDKSSSRRRGYSR